MKNIFLFILLCCCGYSFAQTGRGPGNTNTTTDESAPYTHAIKINTERAIDGPGQPPAPIAGPTAPAADPEDERFIFLIHGLGGDAGAWGKVSEALVDTQFNVNGFQARLVQTAKLEYTQTGGIISAGLDVGQKINTIVRTNQDLEEVDPTRNIIIAHSLGGVVSKALLYNQFCANPVDPQDQFYGGLVTVSSPLNGAEIAGSLVTGKFDEFSNYACQELTAGAFTTVGNFTIVSLLKSLFNVNIDVDTLNKEVCDLVENILPVFFSRSQPPIIGDILPNPQPGTPLANVNACEAANIEKIAFYGIEPYHEDGEADKIFWRTIRHFADNPNNYPHWQANSDEPLALVDAAKLTYIEKITQLDARISALVVDHLVPCNWLAWLTRPIECGLYDKPYWKRVEERNAFQRGLNWFDDVNDQWLDIIGALATQTTTTTAEYICRCSNEYGSWEYPINDPSWCTSTSDETCTLDTETTETTYITLVEKPSDGVILNESARYLTGATQFDVELYNSSHMQMRNDENMRDALQDLFTNPAYGEFWDIEPR